MIRVPLLLLAFAGCAEEPRRRRPRPEPDAPTEPIVWSDVAPLLAERCGGCHQPGGIGPLPLSTWSEVHAARDVVRYQVEERFMPPFPAVVADYPLQSDPSLTEDEVALLSAWIEADAPLGDADPDEPLVPPAPASLPQVDAVLSSAADYQPPLELTNDYRCFVLQPDIPVEGYIRGYEFLVGNRSLIHHAKLLAVSPRDGGLALAGEEALDPAPGFACVEELDPSFGGPSTRLGTWLPGQEVTVYPEGTGIELEPGVAFVLVVHYHPLGSDGLPDRTSVALWLTPTVERVAAVTFVSDSEWRHPPDDGGLLIPAGAQDVHYRWSGRVGRLPLKAFDPGAAGLELLSASFHMHRLGQGGKLSVTVDGAERTLLDIPRWDVDWQHEYWPVEPIRLAANDRISIDCHYDNGAGDRDVPWGEDTEDEMCVSMLDVRAPERGPAPR